MAVAQIEPEVFMKLEPWLDKRGLAEYLACSPRWVVAREEEGMPSEEIAGRLKFKVSEVEPWLREHGHWKRRNG